MKKQEWKVFQPHRLHNKLQILKIYANLTYARPTAWNDDCVKTTVWKPLCDYHFVLTTVWWPLFDDHYGLWRPLCEDHCMNYRYMTE